MATTGMIFQELVISMTINDQKQADKKKLTTSAIFKKNRLAYIDNLKALVIILVIIIHVDVTYSGIGDWFYNEHKNLGNVSFYFFLFIDQFNQAFFMSLFFFIAAYFIPSSLDKKGAVKFIKDRFFRLGIPTIIFIFFIFPVVAKMGHPEVNITQYYLQGIKSFSFISWTGPMWFALTLLLFSIIYVPFNKLFIKITNRYVFEINTKTVLGLTGVITITAFVIRLVYPIGATVINLQLCNFAAYIFMFLLGIIASRKYILEHINYAMAKKWFITSFAIGIPFWILLVYFGVDNNDWHHAVLRGGLNLLAFGYALWGSFFCVAIIIGLIGIFKRLFNTQNSLQKFLSDNAFGVYVFHPLIVVTTSVLLKNLNFQPVLKFMIVVLITIPVSFIFVALIRKVKILSKLFS